MLLGVIALICIQELNHRSLVKGRADENFLKPHTKLYLEIAPPCAPIVTLIVANPPYSLVRCKRNCFHMSPEVARYLKVFLQISTALACLVQVGSDGNLQKKILQPWHLTAKWGIVNH